MMAQKNKPQRVIHVGIGTFGKRWCREFLRTNVDDCTIEVVATTPPHGTVPGFRFVSDPAETTDRVFAQIGRERNGVFFT